MQGRSCQLEVFGACVGYGALPFTSLYARVSNQIHIPRRRSEKLKARARLLRLGWARWRHTKNIQESFHTALVEWASVDIGFRGLQCKSGPEVWRCTPTARCLENTFSGSIKQQTLSLKKRADHAVKRIVGLRTGRWIVVDIAVDLVRHLRIRVGRLNTCYPLFHRACGYDYVPHKAD